MADPPPPKTDPPKDPQREQLQRELDLMTLQAQIATQQHTALLQSLPPSDVKPLDAKTTVDSNVVIEAEILAYRALHDVAKEIADKVTQGRTVLIHDDAGIAAWNAFRTFVAQLHELGKTYDAIAPVNETFALDFTAAGMSVVAVTAAVKTVIDLMALFRVERNIYGVAITIADLALASAVAGLLKAKNCNVLVPQLFPPPADAAAIEWELDAVRQKAAAAAGRTKDAPPDSPVKQRLQQLDVIRQGYEDLFTHVVAEASTALAALVRGAALNAQMSEENAVVLYLKVLRAAGTNETKRSLFGSILKHSGGVVVNYICFKTDATVIASGVLDRYSGEVESVATGRTAEKQRASV